MRALVIEDDSHIADIVAKTLATERFEVAIAEDGEKGVALGKEGHYDVIILDNMLPKRAGAEVCTHIREAGVSTPIIALSALSETDQKVNLLNAGADDYVTKPFSPKELLARVHAMLRRPQEKKHQTFTFGDIVLDTDSRIVTKKSKTIRLTKKEFALLEYFMRRPGVAIAKQELMEEVWQLPYDPESNTIETHIVSLRRKLGSQKDKSFIRTISGIGYRLG